MLSAHSMLRNRAMHPRSKANGRDSRWVEVSTTVHDCGSGERANCRGIISEGLEQKIATVRDKYSEVHDGSFSSQPPLAGLRERLLPRKGGRDSKDCSVQQDLPEAEVNPVPEEQALECRKGHDEGQDVR